MKMSNVFIILLLTVTLISGCSYEGTKEKTIDDLMQQDASYPLDTDTSITDDAYSQSAVDEEIIASEIKDVFVEDYDVDLGDMY